MSILIPVIMELYEKYSLYTLLKDRAEKYKTKTAIYYNGRIQSYSTFLHHVDRMADILSNKLGIKHGDVILIAQPNIPDALYLFYAANKIGAISNMVHPATPYNQVMAIVKKTNAKLAFLFEQKVAKEVDKYRNFPIPLYVTRIEDFLPLPKRLSYRWLLNRHVRKTLEGNDLVKGFTYVSDLKAPHKKVLTYNWNQKATSVILHSGSTTGEPKSICISNENFNSIVFGADTYLPNTKNRSFLTVLPSFHGFGLCMTMHLPVYCGGPLILMPKFKAKYVTKIMKRRQINYIIGVPTIFTKLYADKKFFKLANIKNLDACYCGGDAIKQSLLDGWNEAVRKAGGNSSLYRGYGLTECLAAVTINTKEHHDDISIGTPIPYAEIQIRDEKGNIVNDGEIGEITIKGPSVMNGYFNDKEATSKSIIDGYLYTGDLGYKKGSLIYYTQRKKRVVKVSGVAVFPSEIEAIIEQIPNVEQCCAISVPHPTMEHTIKAYVVASYYDEEGMRQDILSACKRYLIKWAVPTQIEFVKSLPYTLLGKVDFNKLQKEEDAKHQNN